MNLHPAWLIPALPLAAALAVFLGTLRRPRLSASLSILAVLASFALSLGLLSAAWHGTLRAPPEFTWLEAGTLRLTFGAMLDPLSALMLAVVSGVGAAIQVYSLVYMQGDRGLARYFACMSLFTFAMLFLVIASNFLQMFLGWELVGVSSYLLIGFWFERRSAANAARKAFLANRLGDFGFMLGILLIASTAGTLDFAALRTAWPALHLPAGLAAAAALLIFCGAAGKSAQIPLHVWLPDAMEGPTPVSALIHAATMVAAGVYMLCRTAWLLAASPAAAAAVAWIGGATALLAALMAVTQQDIKRVLAYSTLSQLGYMVMAAGLGGPTQSMFHLTTHAFFKALLFLCAGNVIMALHHEQDIRRMGGLRRKLPLTFASFAIGTLALCGIWPMSGFYSKDAILLLAREHCGGLFAIGLLTAGLTALYMGRLFIAVFLGEPRDRAAQARACEAPLPAILPVAALAASSVAAGWGAVIPRFLDPAAPTEHPSAALAAIFLAVPLLGFLAAAFLFARPEQGDARLRRWAGPLYRLVDRKFFFDEAYSGLAVKAQNAVAALCEFIDLRLLQKAGVDGAAAVMMKLGACVRWLQTGDVRVYALFYFAGILALLAWVVLGVS
jgi:NADH-quinone oxidoreductase subunit L